MPITSNILSSDPTHDEVYSIQHYVIKFVSDFRQVDGFLRVLRFPPPIKLTATVLSHDVWRKNMCSDVAGHNVCYATIINYINNKNTFAAISYIFKELDKT
jgi:hypothetical protein